MAAAAVRCQGVASRRAGAVEAAGAVVTAVGTNVTSGGKSAFVYIWKV